VQPQRMLASGVLGAIGANVLGVAARHSERGQVDSGVRAVAKLAT
jgi:hypothetical protein